MLSDEEREAIEYWQYIRDTQIYDGYKGQVYAVTLLNLTKKQSKEIEELKEKHKPQPDCAESIERTEEMVNMRWVNHNYILKSESEQKEKQAYIDGTNAAHELCNKKWKAKIKARIKELEEYLYKGNIKDDFLMIRIKAKIQELQSLLEKE